MNVALDTKANPITSTIIAQLGSANRLRIMTGCKHIVADEENRRINIGLPGKKIVRITLEADDTYTVEMLRISTRKEWVAGAGMFKVAYSEEGVYADSLQDAFTRATGLYLSL